MIPTITPFKNRALDSTKPVRVYRNLHSKSESTKYSIKQNHLVIGHTNDLLLKNCTLEVNKKGQEKVRREKKKYVHAYVKGYISQEQIRAIIKDQITYNPYQDDGFKVNGIITHNAELIHIQDGVRLCVEFQG
jgi:hypothetical protein